MSGRSRFYFLRSNGFFESTPLTGYSFIQASKTLVETCLWYFVILVLTVAAVFGAKETVLLYLSNPTRTYVQVASSTPNTSLGNLTFDLRTSLLEFSPVIPTGLPYVTPSTSGVDKWVHFIACNMRLPMYEIWKSLAVKEIVVDLIGTWLGSLNDTEDEISPEDEANVYDLSDQELFKKWTRKPQQYFSKVSTYLITSGQRDLVWKGDKNEGKKKKEHEAMLDKAQQLINEPLKGRKNTAAYLLILEALSENKDPKWKFFGGERVLSGHNQQQQLVMDGILANFERGHNEPMELSDDMWNKLEPLSATLHEAVVNAAAFKGSAAELIDELEMSMDQILEQVYHGLRQMFYIKADKARTWLEDYSYGIGTFPYNDGNGHSNTGTDGWQNLQLLMETAPGERAIQIQIHSAVYQYFYEAILALGQFMHQVERKCKRRGDLLTMGVAADFNEAHFLESMLQFYKETTSLVMDNPGGNSIKLEPFLHYTIILKPNAEFLSKTDTCYKKSYKFCLDECQAESHQKQCGCIPWTLHHHTRAAKLCDKPCSNVSDSACKDKCQVFFQHSCSVTLFQMEHMSATKAQFNVDKLQPVFNLEIKIVPFSNHPQFIETYDMTRDQLAAQLGGQLEFWIGLNLLGILHGVVYLVKQIIHLNQPDSNAAFCMKRLFGKTSTADQHNPKGTDKKKTVERLELLEVKMDRMSRDLNARLSRIENSFARYGSSKSRIDRK